MPLRIDAKSTHAAIKLGAAHNPDAPAIQFLLNADPADTPAVTTYRDFVGSLTRAANVCHALGADCVVSFLFPLVPEAFITLLAAANLAGRLIDGMTPAHPLPSAVRVGLFQR